MLCASSLCERQSANLFRIFFFFFLTAEIGPVRQGIPASPRHPEIYKEVLYGGAPLRFVSSHAF